MRSSTRTYVNPRADLRQHIAKRAGDLASLPGPGDSLGKPTSSAVQLTGLAVPFNKVDAGVSFDSTAFDSFLESVGSSTKTVPLIDENGAVIGQAELSKSDVGLSVSAWLSGADVNGVAELVGLTGAGLILEYDAKTVAQGFTGDGNPTVFVQEAVPSKVTLFELPQGDTINGGVAVSGNYSPGRSASRVNKVERNAKRLAEWSDYHAEYDRYLRDPASRTKPVPPLTSNLERGTRSKPLDSNVAWADFEKSQARLRIQRERLA